ncbi:MAG: hypothetical protein ACLFQA_00360 [Bacteroidales bacterium]
MSYGPKYELEVKSKSGRVDNVIINELDYTGSLIGRGAGPPYFTLRRDAAQCIEGTSLELTIEALSDFEYLGLYTEEAKKYKAEYRADGNIKFVGYILPERYGEPYIAPPYDVGLTFTDGLGLLKDEDFTLIGRNTYFETIQYCLDKLDIDIGYSINIHLWDSGMSTNRSPLEQAYEYTDKYIGYNCYEVLEYILSLFDAKLKQGGNEATARWYIERYNDKARQPFLYTSEGVYESLGTAATVSQLGSDVDPVGALRMDMLPASKRLEVRQDYGKKDNIIEGNFFEMDGRYSVRDHWTWGTGVGNFELAPYYEPENPYVRFTGTGQDSTFTKYIYTQIDIETTDRKLLFEFQFALVSEIIRPANYYADNFKGAAGVMIKLVGTSTYYLHETNGWQLGEHIIETNEFSVGFPTVNSYRSPEYKKLSILSDGFSIDGTLEIRLYNVQNPDYNDSHQAPGIAYRSAVFNLMEDSETPAYAGKQIFADGNLQAAESDSPIELIGGDLPTFGNANIQYEYGIELSTGTLTEDWNNADTATERLIIEHLIYSLASRRRKSLQTLSGSLDGSIDFGSIIQHNLNSDKKFYIHEASWNLYDDRVEATLHEIAPYTPDDVVITGTAEVHETGVRSQPEWTGVGGGGEYDDTALWEAVDERWKQPTTPGANVLPFTWDPVEEEWTFDGKVYFTDNIASAGEVSAFTEGIDTSSWWDQLQAEVTSQINLTHLKDVNASSPSEDQVLTWNGSAWVPATVESGGIFTETDPVFTSWRDSWAQNRIAGRISSGTGAIEQLTGAQVRTIADVYSKSEGDGRYLLESNNLSDLTSASTARGNLELGTAATQDATDFGRLASGITNDWASVNLFGNDDIRFVRSASDYIRTTSDTNYIYFYPVKENTGDTSKALRYRFNDDQWEFRDTLMVGDATAATHAMNRQTGDGRWGRLGAENEWTEKNTWKKTGNSYLEADFSTGNGMFSQGWDNQSTPESAFILRTYAISGVQLTLNKGGISAAGDVIAYSS